jgi:hypothetical protein
LGGWGGLSRRRLVCGISECGSRVGLQRKCSNTFALAVVKQFRANQGVLLAGAVAYYTLLSLVPLLILILMALSHVIAEDRLLVTLSEYLEFVVPGQSTALVDEVRTFLAQKQVVGGILFVTMLFFSALAFTILENAMSVIFYHRVKIKRRHFLVSAVMPYLFILFLKCWPPDRYRSVGGAAICWHPEHHDSGSTPLTGPNFYFSSLYSRRYRRDVATHRNLFRYARRAIVVASRTDRGRDGYAALGNDAPHSGLVLHHNVANPIGLRLTHHGDRGVIERRDWRTGLIGGRAGDRRI